MGYPDACLFFVLVALVMFQSHRRGMGYPDLLRLKRASASPPSFNPLDGAWAIRTRHTVVDRHRRGRFNPLDGAWAIRTLAWH